MPAFSKYCVCVCAQSCPTLCDPVNCSPQGSSVHGILQARILEWVVSPSPGDLPGPGIEPASPEAPVLQADSLPAKPSGKPPISITISTKWSLSVPLGNAPYYLGYRSWTSVLLEFNHHDVHVPEVKVKEQLGLIKGSGNQHSILIPASNWDWTGQGSKGQLSQGSLLQGQRRYYDEFCLRDEEGNLYLLRAYYVPGTYEKQKLEQ